jgi:hypothetical protein
MIRGVPGTPREVEPDKQAAEAAVE